MDRRRLVVGAIVVLLAAAAGAGLAGLGPGADGGGPDDGRPTETTTETDRGGTPSPATARERATSTTADAVSTPAQATARERATPTTDGKGTPATTVDPAGGSSGQSGAAERDPAADPEPTATSDRATASDAVRTTAPTSTPAVVTPTDPFEVRIERVEPCGQFCRDITASLTNRQATPATDVVVTTRLYPGNGTDGRPVWTGRVAVGTLGPGATETTNERVELSIFDAFAISDAGGWVTISTTIQSGERTVTVTERRQVA